MHAPRIHPDLLSWSSSASPPRDLRCTEQVSPRASAGPSFWKSQTTVCRRFITQCYKQKPFPLLQKGTFQKHSWRGLWCDVSGALQRKYQKFLTWLCCQKCELSLWTLTKLWTGRGWGPSFLCISARYSDLQKRGVRTWRKTDKHDRSPLGSCDIGDRHAVSGRSRPETFCLYTLKSARLSF